MYTDINFKSKKDLKAAVAAYKAGTGRPVTYRDLTGPVPVRSGKIFVEGPHYPAAHGWYAECVVRDGCIVSVR